jgi:hypothetical protein
MEGKQFTIRFVRDNRFAEVEQDNQLVFTRRGQVGEPGSEEMKAFKDFDLAAQYVREQAATLLGEGYARDEPARQTQGSVGDQESRGQDQDSAPPEGLPEQIAGTSPEALDWIAASTLAPSRTEALTRFVRRFPALTFYRLQRNQPHWLMPQWLCEMERTCCGFAPGQLKWLRFSRRGPWYHWMYSLALSSEHRRVFLGTTLLLVICAVIDDHPVLALKLGDASDQRVYEFDWEDVTSRGDGDGALDEDHITARFDSLADLLASVEAVRLEGGSVIQAARS